MLQVRSSLKKMICSFYKSDAKYINFDVVNVEGQNNSHDCGVYALANAVELAIGGDPATCRWNSHGGAMRSHLISCFESGKLTRFPQLGKRRIPLGRCVLTSLIKLLRECALVQ